MKAELVITGRPTKPIDLSATPRAGEVVFIDGHRATVKEIVHDVGRKKLQVVCEEPNPFEAFCHAPEAVIDTEVDEDDE